MGTPVLLLEIDGHGRMNGDPIRWKIEREQLVIASEGEEQRLDYALEGPCLKLALGPAPIELIREPGSEVEVDKDGGAAADASPSPRPRPPAAAPLPPPGDALSRLLVSSAWCSTTFDREVSTLHTVRVSFLADGTWALDQRGGAPSRSVFGQREGTARGRWKVVGQRLSIGSAVAPELKTMALEVSQDNDGNPLIKANRVTYRSCN